MAHPVAGGIDSHRTCTSLTCSPPRNPQDYLLFGAAINGVMFALGMLIAVASVVAMSYLRLQTQEASLLLPAATSASNIAEKAEVEEVSSPHFWRPWGALCCTGPPHPAGGLAVS